MLDTRPPDAPAPTDAAGEGPTMPRAVAVLVGLLALAAALLAAVVLARPAWVDATPSTRGSAQGTALVLLVVAVPLLLGGAWRWAARASWRGAVVALGAAGYLAYNGVVFALGLPFGRTFLPAIAMLGLAFWTLVVGLARLDVAALARHAGDRMPARAIGGVLVVVAVLFALVWLRDIVPAVLDGTVARSVAEAGTSTNAVEVVDLAVSLPATALAGVLLWRRRAWGLLLSGVMLVLFAVEGLGVAVDQWSAHLADPAVGLGGAVAFVVVTVLWLIPLAVYLVRLGGPAPADWRRARP